MPFTKRSLLARNLIWINLIAFVLISGASVVAHKAISNENQRFLADKVTFLSEFVGQTASTAVWNFDVDLLSKLSAALMKDPDIVAVEFLDKKNKNMISEITPPPFSKSLELPILDPKGETQIGSLRMHYSEQKMRSNLTTITRALVAFAIVFQLILSLSVTFSLKKSISRLEGAIELLKESSQKANKTGLKLKELSTHISSKGSVQAAAIEETSATLTQLSAILTKTVDSSKQAFQMSNTSLLAAEQGKSGNENLLQAMNEITISANKIQEIIGVVDDIAFQTNLLALNAAVEAARAGEQGKGFAVVADAVRVLAHKSAESAKDIHQLIIESSQRIKNGMSLVESNSIAFQDILKSVHDLKEINSALAQSSEEQNAGILQITAAIQEIDQSLNESASSTLETANEADHMAEQSGELNKIIEDFEIEIKGRRLVPT